VRTLLVEVADVDAEDVLELAAPEDQEPVAGETRARSNQRVGRGDQRADPAARPQSFPDPRQRLAASTTLRSV